MDILTLYADDFDNFLQSVSNKLASAIAKKLHAYTQANAIPMSNPLKILKPKIWGYKGTIYKLRVDCGKESARVLFAKNKDNNIVMLHGFIKKTRKTPSKDAKIAMANLEQMNDNAALKPLVLTSYLNNHL